ncbi:short-chain dehydrogenase/reductase SDR [Karstenula rhodostoma CBS 690.94]|uniref:Short-chain dehydrogenase/reductase SDR n=1 Tax=Karstenula rhodostoma CBS 690.94 TaxID=1392251 RepID=A0A9P4P8Q6_9PLEO|nr:short-chain dehydrogenase/reductase SDR [Karstenula rhodostoma CBS 690.94]
MALLIDGVALVTGAGSGIGREVAIAYAAYGARALITADLNYSSAENTARESEKLATNPSFRTLALAVDVSDPSSVNSMVETAVKEFGRIDYSINSAGIGVQKPASIQNVDIDEMNRFWRINVMGTVNSMKAVSTAMIAQDSQQATTRGRTRDIGRGVIINLASCSSYMATPDLTQYTTSKYAVLGLTKNAALDLAKHGVRVNAICPSWVETPMVEAAVAGNKELEQMMQKVIPMGRIAKVEEVADVIVFMSSPLASYVTGVGWIVDGGTLLQLQSS